jgi:hypothetical protein
MLTAITAIGNPATLHVKNRTYGSANQNAATNPAIIKTATADLIMQQT